MVRDVLVEVTNDEDIVTERKKAAQTPRYVVIVSQNSAGRRAAAEQRLGPNTAQRANLLGSVAFITESTSRSQSAAAVFCCLFRECFLHICLVETPLRLQPTHKGPITFLHGPTTHESSQ